MHLLIVDDERQVREGLAARIDWARAGVTRISHAANGKEALALHMRDRADLILSDVRMPQMDGVALLRHLRDIDDNVPFIFLSGFSDKEYLMAAIRHQAVDYLEKPVDMDALLQVAVRAMKNSGGAKSSRLGEILSKTPGFAAAVGYRAALLLYPPRGGFGAGIVIGTHFLPGSDEAAARARALDETLGRLKLNVSIVKDVYLGDLLLIALDGRGEDLSEELFAEMRRRMPEGRNPALLLHEPVRSLRELTGAMDAVLHGVDRVQLRGAAVYRIGLPPPDTAQIVEECVGALLGARKGEQLFPRERMMQMFLRLRRAEGMTLDGMHEAARHACGMIQQAALSVGLRPAATPELEDHLPLETILRAVIHYADVLLSGILARKGVAPPVAKALEYIESHIDRGISIPELAAHCFLSASRISHLFRQEMGLSIVQYVNSLRIEQAKLLLLDPGVKLYDIAQRVGIQDTAYFSRLFQKLMGVSPSAYREDNL